MQIGIPFVIRNTPEGKELKFRKLTPYDRFELLRREKVRRKAWALESLKAAGADKAEIASELFEIDKAMLGHREFLELFDSVAGKADVLDLAVSVMTLPTPGQPMWSYAPDAEELRALGNSLELADFTSLAAELCAVKLQTAEPDPDESEVDDTYGAGENPTTPTPETSPASGPTVTEQTT